MADNVTISTGLDVDIATDEVGGVHHQLVKVAFGDDGAATMVSDDAPLPVGTLATSLYGQVDIAVSGTVSTAWPAGTQVAFGIVIPAAFTGAAITFQVSADGTTYQPLYDAYGVLVSVPVTQGRSYHAPPELAPWAYFKVVSGSAEADDRIIMIAAKG